jgi:Zn/Cd-binding protein ZinT
MFVRLDTRFIEIGYGDAGCIHLEYVKLVYAHVVIYEDFCTHNIYPKKAREIAVYKSNTQQAIEEWS